MSELHDMADSIRQAEADGICALHAGKAEFHATLALCATCRELGTICPDCREQRFRYRALSVITETRPTAKELEATLRALSLGVERSPILDESTCEWVQRHPPAPSLGLYMQQFGRALRPHRVPTYRERLRGLVDDMYDACGEYPFETTIILLAGFVGGGFWVGLFAWLWS